MKRRRPDPDRPAHYELRVEGCLDEHWTAWLGGLTLLAQDDGTTILRGAVTDQAELHGLLAKVRDLGATLISLTSVDPESPQSQEQQRPLPGPRRYPASALRASTAHPRRGHRRDRPNRSDSMSTITAERPTTAPDLPLYRLHLMRAGYLLMGVGLAVVKWPLIVNGADSLPLFEGVVACILTAMSLLAFLGLRYPVKLLPLLLLESAWKLLWLAVVALPRAAAGELDAATQEVVISCSLVVVIVAVTPWRYAWRQYASAKGDRWR